MTEDQARAEIANYVDKSFKREHGLAGAVATDRLGAIITLEPALMSGSYTYNGETATLGSTAAHETLLEFSSFAQLPITAEEVPGVTASPLVPKVKYAMFGVPSPSVAEALDAYNATVRLSGVHNYLLWSMGYPEPTK